MTNSMQKPILTTRPKYENIWDWYHPEIDFFEMLENMSWTDNDMNRILKRDYPNDNLMLMDYCNMFEYNAKGECFRPGRRQLFQFWNKQFNNELAKLIKSFHPKLVLDVCAGDGMLAEILSKRGINVVAVDNHEWKYAKHFYTVEESDYKDALKKYQPDVVVGCWMPLGTDWTPDFRATDSVRHYVMIGEGGGGCTGGDWDEHDNWTADFRSSKYNLCRTDWVVKDSSPSAGSIFRPLLKHSIIDFYSRKETQIGSQ